MKGVVEIKRITRVTNCVTGECSCKVTQHQSRYHFIDKKKKKEKKIKILKFKQPAAAGRKNFMVLTKNIRQSQIGVTSDILHSSVSMDTNSPSLKRIRFSDSFIGPKWIYDK